MTPTVVAAPATRRACEAAVKSRPLAALPAGPWDAAPLADVLAALTAFSWWNTRRQPAQRSTAGAGLLLDWLSRSPGSGWQERWEHAEAMLGTKWATWSAAIPESARPGSESHRVSLTRGLACLLRMRLVRPSYAFLTRYSPTTTFAVVRASVSPQLFTRAADAARRRGQSENAINDALHVLTAIVIHTGGGLDEITTDDLVAFQSATARRRARARDGSHTAWQMMVDLGIFPSSSTLRAALQPGPQTTVELVDRHGIADRQIRELIIRYLDERRPTLDYSSFRNLVGRLAGAFWVDLERHHPGIDTINLPRDITDAWKERLRFPQAGGSRPTRQRHIDILITVRAFYLDIAEWALSDPSWAPWAFPSPVRKSDTAGVAKHHRETTTRMHQRTRERLPQLPRLVDTAENWKNDQAALLAAAGKTEPGAVFEHAGTRFRRIGAADRPTTGRYRPTHVLVEDTATGILNDLSITEDETFWAWAVIETLRHTGIRIEELLELTHLALVSHRMPDTGELVPLLQIVPSKGDEERLLLVTPELASVLAAIISRVRGADGTIPLVSRYDSYERVTGPALPHLFQHRDGFMHRNGWRNDVLGMNTVRHLLNRAIARTGLTDATGQPLRYTPHDFRRMFATEAVTGGLPVHIAAKILGHASINTTQAYTAVFQDQLIRTYRAFVDERRALRPREEYRDPTDAEWAEFQQHFHTRKLELGDCGRPYGTPCVHEHACVRCPMLRVDPRQRTRLEQIIRNLGDRIDEARTNGWLGEVEGLKISLAAARHKLTTLDRAARNTPRPAPLGMPAIPPKIS
ncbi:site-specific integrase [Protofrankia symbiont of Coriaria ruscifolia]|uniref:site-specific integrase n=1 Tax=Protofrankia symbiont of Coriaria ruscifolia TaxID=1306542 RepID=UPI001F5E943B|nr:site-specific integrase [Protofrankia symbiont of Coriaria ruscifolia]